MSTHELINRANGFISRRAKLSCLLAYVELTNIPPHGMSEGTRQIWEAMEKLGIIEISNCHHCYDKKVKLTGIGRSLLENFYENVE